MFECVFVLLEFGYFRATFKVFLEGLNKKIFYACQASFRFHRDDNVVILKNLQKFEFLVPKTLLYYERRAKKPVVV